MKIKKAVILAAGFGSRLKHLTENIPKALLPIGGTTLIERTIQLLIEQDFDEIFIVSGYAHDILENYLNNSILKNKIKLTIIYNENY